MSFKDSGEREVFATGANRDRHLGKGRFDLAPPFSAMFIARIYETGCLKYGDRNWENGITISSYVDSAKRHIEKYQAGLRDEPHLSMAGWNISCALWTGAMILLGLRPKELFDLPSHIGSEQPLPLSPFEIEGLEKFLGKKIGEQ